MLHLYIREKHSYWYLWMLQQKDITKTPAFECSQALEHAN